MVLFEDNWWITDSQASGFRTHIELLQEQIKDFEEKMARFRRVMPGQVDTVWVVLRNATVRELCEEVVEFVLGLVHRRKN